MDAKLRTRLEAAGWVIGDTQQFLGLTDLEMAIIDIRIALVDAVCARRRASRVTQATLANRIGSSQSRVAKMEAGDPGVSIELLIHALLALGATPRDVGRVIARRVA